MAEKIGLKSDSYIIVDITRKTQAQVIKSFKVGDILQFEMEIENTSGASGGGQYASYVRIVNLTQKMSVWKSQNQLLGLLKDLLVIEKV